jgi:hypothetical protein
MAAALGWSYANGDPNKSKVHRVLQALKDDKLAKVEGKQWALTRAGQRKAKNLPPDPQTTEAPW